MEIEHETDSDQEVFIDEELMDWGHAAYMAGLSSNTDKVDEKLHSKVVSQLNNIRAGLNKQQQGMDLNMGAIQDDMKQYMYMCLDVSFVFRYLVVMQVPEVWITKGP